MLNASPCKDCIVYAMCKDMCNEANNYVNETKRYTQVDDWTWTVVLRENAHRHNRRV